MCTENKCEECKFFKRHTLLGEKGIETLGGSCLVTNTTTKYVIANNVVTFDLQNQCPLKRLKEHERLQYCWSQLIEFIANLEIESENLEFQAKRLLRDIISKIKQLRKGDN
jgi:hypothetical protein